MVWFDRGAQKESFYHTGEDMCSAITGGFGKVFQLYNLVQLRRREEMSVAIWYLSFDFKTSMLLYVDDAAKW